MSTDIVERARAASNAQGTDDALPPMQVCLLLGEAADEIERLRAGHRNETLIVGQIVLAAGGSVRVPSSQMLTADRVTVKREEEIRTGDIVFTAKRVAGDIADSISRRR
jgi:hypothetical protein